MKTINEAASVFEKNSQDFTPWVWGPQLHWFGLRTLLPFSVGHDEYARRTLVIGWSITGRVISPLWYCGSEDCVKESMQAIQRGDYDV